MQMYRASISASDFGLPYRLDGRMRGAPKNVLPRYMMIKDTYAPFAGYDERR